MQAPINQLYKFGQLCLDVSELVLRRDGRVAPLSPKLFEVLAPITFRPQSIVVWMIPFPQYLVQSDNFSPEPSAASLLLGEFHPIRRLSEPGGQAMT
jgi:hypothetical protein